METQETYTAFEGPDRLFKGNLQDVVLKTKRRLGRAENSSILIFSDATGRTIEFNFHGSEKDVSRRLEMYVDQAGNKPSSGPGRPRLGVISREISLLPRHWEWLATQSGGASAAIRRLIEEAKKKSAARGSIKQLQERAYQFMTVIAGDLAGYEEALRALYRADRKHFLLKIQDWPCDIKNYLMELAEPVFEASGQRGE